MQSSGPHEQNLDIPIALPISGNPGAKTKCPVGLKVLQALYPDQVAGPSQRYNKNDFSVPSSSLTGPTITETFQKGRTKSGKVDRRPEPSWDRQHSLLQMYLLRCRSTLGIEQTSALIAYFLTYHRIASDASKNPTSLKTSMKPRSRPSTSDAAPKLPRGNAASIARNIVAHEPPEYRNISLALTAYLLTYHRIASHI